MALTERILLGQYVAGHSFWHRLDPRAKILWTILWMGTLFAVSTVWGYMAFVGVLLLVVAISRLPVGALLRGVRPLLYLIVFTVAFNVLFTPGVVLWRWGFLTVTREGLVTAAQVTARLLLLLTGASVLTLTTSPLALADGLEALLRPGQRWGLPAHEMAMMMSIALRFIPTLLEETEKIMKAQKARGADFESGNLLTRARSLIPVLIPLFVNAFRRADDLALAMEARAYRGGQGRTHWRELQWGWADSATLLASVVLLLGVAWYL